MLSKRETNFRSKDTHVWGWKSYYLCDLNNSKLETAEHTYLLIITFKHKWIKYSNQKI